MQFVQINQIDLYFWNLFFFKLQFSKEGDYEFDILLDWVVTAN